MTLLIEFYEMLQRHDWFYEFSDDHSVWQRGETSKTKLISISTQTPEHRTLYNGFVAHYYSGASWKTEKKPLPPKPNEP